MQLFKLWLVIGASSVVVAAPILAQHLRRDVEPQDVVAPDSVIGGHTYRKRITHRQFTIGPDFDWSSLHWDEAATEGYKHTNNTA